MNILTPILYVDEVEDYLKNGVRVEEVFKLSSEMLLSNTNNPDNLFEIFSLFYQYNMPVREIQSWFVANADFSVLEDIVNNEEKWEQIGLEPNGYVDRYLAWRSILHHDTR